MEEMLMKKMDPLAYKEKVKAYKDSERLAKQKAGKHGLKPKCLIQ
jgi:hypothetical protein